jgi:hypothetical protein
VKTSLGATERKRKLANHASRDTVKKREAQQQNLVSQNEPNEQNNQQI